MVTDQQWPDYLTKLAEGNRSNEFQTFLTEKYVLKRAEQQTKVGNWEATNSNTLTDKWTKVSPILKDKFGEVYWN